MWNLWKWLWNEPLAASPQFDISPPIVSGRCGAARRVPATAWTTASVVMWDSRPIFPLVPRTSALKLQTNIKLFHIVFSVSNQTVGQSYCRCWLWLVGCSCRCASSPSWTSQPCLRTSFLSHTPSSTFSPHRSPPVKSNPGVCSQRGI